MEFNLDITYFSLVFMRMFGFIFLNQIFGRGGIPNTFKTGLTLVLSVVVYGLLPQKDIQILGGIDLAILVIKEVSIGFTVGYIIESFFGVIPTGGTIMDMQIGLAMSQIYNPQVNLSMGISGTFLHIMAYMYFFSAGGHIALIRIFITSYELIGIADFIIVENLFINMYRLFSQMLILSVKLAMPLIVIQMILQAAVGVLMKAVPQINVFSVNIQLKIVVGLFIIIVLVPTFASFIERLMILMLDNIENNLSLLVN